MNLLTHVRPRYWEWGLLLFLFLSLRLGSLALFHPFYNNVCPIEEYYRGTLGHEILKGLSMPYWQYRADDSGGGSLVMGILVAGFFKILGSSAFVLKLIPVLISMGALLVWFRILYREFSSKCAWYFALFFIFAPSYFQSWSTVALGDHYETMFLSAVAVWLFLKMERKPSPVFLFLLGLVCGFGIWFAYIFALTVVTLLILWFCKKEPSLSKGTVLYLIAGFAIGFSPWIAINLKNGFKGFVIYGIPLWRHIQHYPVLSLTFWKVSFWKTLFIYDIFQAFSHPDLGLGAFRPLVSWIYTFLLTAPVVVWFFLRPSTEIFSTPFFRKTSSQVTLYFIFYGLVHSAVIQLTDFTGNRYLMPLMPAIFFGWARVMESLESFSPRIRKASRILFAGPLIGLGVWLWISMASPAYAGYLLKTPGYSYDYMASIPACNINTNIRKVDIDAWLNLSRQMSEKISSEGQKGFWTAMSIQMAETAAARGVISIVERAKFPDPIFAAAFYFHFGRFVFYYRGQNLAEAFSDLKSYLHENTAALRLSTLGMFYALGNEEPESILSLEREIPEELNEEYFTAFGMQYGRFWTRKGSKIEAMDQKISELFSKIGSKKERAAFLKGLEFF